MRQEKKRAITVYLPPDTYHKIELLAQNLMFSKGKVIRDILNEHLQEVGFERPKKQYQDIPLPGISDSPTRS